MNRRNDNERQTAIKPILNQCLLHTKQHSNLWILNEKPRTRSFWLAFSLCWQYVNWFFNFYTKSFPRFVVCLCIWFHHKSVYICKLAGKICLAQASWVIMWEAQRNATDAIHFISFRARTTQHNNQYILYCVAHPSKMSFNIASITKCVVWWKVNKIIG